MAVHMGISSTIVNIDQQRVTAALDQAAKKLNSEAEVALDLSSVRRLDASDVQRLENFARVANEKKVKVLLRGVNVDIYKALKLTKLSGEFWFVS
jgi:anti-anti-sigma regulatory factor